jgi:O-antigen/teichoic acid export membrane protein
MSLAKQVIGGAAVVTVAGAGARLLAILTVPILSPLLGPVPYGVAALVGTVVSLASVLALLGIDMAYARFYLQEDEHKRSAVERFCWRFALTGSLITALVASCGWWWIGDQWLAEYRSIAAYSVIGIVLTVAAAMATTRIRLMGNYRRIAGALFVASVVSSALSIGLALLWRRDEWALLFGTVVGTVTTLLLLGLPNKSILLQPSQLPPETKRAVVTLGLAGSVTAPMYWVISSADRWFIGEYRSTAEIGIYSMAASVAMLGLMLNSSLTLSWFPEASRAYGEKGRAALPSLGRLWSRLVVGLAVVWLMVASAGGDILRLLAAPAFHEGAKYIIWLAGGVFFYGLASLANTALLLESRMRFAAYSWIAGALVCVLLNFVWVPHLGALGAAMAQCVSYGLIALSILIVSHRVLPMPIPIFRLGLALLITICTGVFMAPAWAANPAASLVFKLPVGLLAVMAILRVIAPDWYHRLHTRLFDVFAARKT